MPDKKKKKKKKKKVKATANEVPPELLRWECDVNCLVFETTAEIDPAIGVVGQPTAYEALKFGIECLSRGQNVYVRGARGTGRNTMVRQMLAALQPESDSNRDFCYVHNFSRPDHPRLVTLPPGTAHEFRKEMQSVAEFFEEGLIKALDEEPYRGERQAVQDRVQEEIKQTTDPLEKEIEANGMAMVQVQQGPATQTLIMPVVGGEPVPPEQLKALIAAGKAQPEQLEQYEEALPKYQKQMLETGRKVSELIRAATKEIHDLMEKVARQLSANYTRTVLEKFPGEAVKIYIAEVIDDVVENHLQSDNEQQRPDFKELYGVNVVLSQEDKKLRPVIEENTPSLINLLGTVEPEFGPGGMAVSDFRGIRAGALLQADNGYLVLDVNDVLSEAGAWRALMRTLRTGRLEIVPAELGWMRQTVLTQPEPIPIQVRVILVGDMQTYYQLDHADPDFRELFKVLADFDSELQRDSNGVSQYASVVAGLTQSEGLPPFHRTAVAALAEHGARIVSRRDRLTARFGRIADIAREAAFLAKDDVVTDKHVKSAVKRTRSRASLPSRKFREMVESQTIVVQTDGEVVGQINGLAVMRSGPLTYGFPARITATIGPGSAGLINIEGRAQMSGAIHTKGFHILGGLMRHLLRTKHPMTFSASLAFEQSYGGIDGDSASGAEIVCLLSALTKIPVKQSMAMTGAIDQHGHLEAIGGVNEKIEGFYDACDYFGLTGEQGCVVPKSNAGDLMLREDIVKACAKGKFHVYAVDNIYDAIELMTGTVAGRPGEDGEYPEDSLLAKAHDEVENFWRLTLASPISVSNIEESSPSDVDQPIAPPTDDPRRQSPRED